MSHARLSLCALASMLAVWPASPARQTSSPARFDFGGNAAEIPAEFIENLVFLPVSVNKSQPFLFEFDTTAAASSSDQARATDFGLIALQNPVLHLPGVEYRVPALPASVRENFAAQIGRPYQGTLGNDFLASVVVDIDYSRQTLRIYDPGAYNYQGKGTSFPLTFAGGATLVRAKLELPGQKAREGEFVVNTALHAAIHISEQSAEKHHLFSAKMKAVQACDPQINDGSSIALGRAKEFQFGSYHVESAIVATSPQRLFGESEKNVAGTIGAGILKRFIVTFDYPHRRMILAPNSQFAEYEEEDKSGLAVVAKGLSLKTFEVLAVQPSTPASEVGIQKGDIIAGIDDEPAADLTLASVRHLFRQIGHRYKLTIERNRQTLQITLQMRRLI